MCAPKIHGAAHHPPHNYVVAMLKMFSFPKYIKHLLDIYHPRTFYRSHLISQRFSTGCFIEVNWNINKLRLNFGFKKMKKYSLSERRLLMILICFRAIAWWVISEIFESHLISVGKWGGENQINKMWYFVWWFLFESVLEI